MSDSIQRYYAELRAVEDEWHSRHGWEDRAFGTSFWTSRLEQLRDIGARHGVRPDDPRVYSIAAYQDERRAIEEEWDKLCLDKGWGDLDPTTPNYRLFRSALSRLWARLDDCKVRHFPGLNDLRPETIDSIPKLWAHIALHLPLVVEQVHRFNPEPNGRRPETCDKDVQRVYSVLHRLKIPWAPAPPYPSFTQQEARDELVRLANLLEREDAAPKSRPHMFEDLPPEVRNDIRSVLLWIDANPNGLWRDMGDLKAIYDKWRDIIVSLRLLDNSGTMHTVPHMTGRGHLYLIECQTNGAAQGAPAGQMEGEQAEGIDTTFRSESKGRNLRSSPNLSPSAEDAALARLQDMAKLSAEEGGRVTERAILAALHRLENATSAEATHAWELLYSRMKEIAGWQPPEQVNPPDRSNDADEDSNIFDRITSDVRGFPPGIEQLWTENTWPALRDILNSLPRAVATEIERAEEAVAAIDQAGVEQSEEADADGGHGKSASPTIRALPELREWLKVRVRWLRDWHMAPDPKPIPPAFLDAIVSRFGQSRYPAPDDPARRRQWAGEHIWRFSEDTIHRVHGWLEAHDVFGGPDWLGHDPLTDERILIDSLEHLSALLNFIGVRARERSAPAGSNELTEYARLSPLASLDAPLTTFGHAPVEQAEGSGTDGGHAEAASPEKSWVFTQSGDGYFIAVPEGQGHFAGLKGFGQILQLLRSPAGTVPMRLLVSDAGVAQPGVDRWSRQPTIGPEGFEQIGTKRRELKADLAKAQKDNNLPEADRIQAELEELEATVTVSMGLGNTARDLNNDRDRLRPTIHASLKRAYEALRKGKPALNALADHFELSISSESGCFVYRPSPRPCWRHELPEKK